MLQYDYVEPKKLNPYQVVREGEGKFTIISAEWTESKNGNQMFVITFRLTDSIGATTLYKNLTFPPNSPEDNQKIASKVFNILNAINKPHLYGKPLDPRDIIGTSGKCVIKTEPPKNPAYGDQSVIAKFISVVNPEYHEQELSKVDDQLPF